MKRTVLVLALAALSACERDQPAPPAPPETGQPAQPRRAPPPEAADASPTLREIRGRGRLRCGVHTGLPGFAYPDTRGVWRGFDVDFCRALAAAVLGDARRVDFVRVANPDRIEALRSGRVDVLARNTTWTLQRDAEAGVDFAGVFYYDGQGFLTRRSLGLASAAELQGARVCVQTDTTSQANLDDWFRSRGIEYTPVVVRDGDAARRTYQEEGCDAYSSDISALAAARSILNNPTAHVILPEVISREPLAPVVREGDDGWRDTVRWTLNALLTAEELGVTSRNAEQMRETSTNPEIRRLLGVEPGLGARLGLDESWAYEAILAVGNYGEMFSRNLGDQSPLRLERGLNALWNAEPERGLHYPLPMR